MKSTIGRPRRVTDEHIQLILKWRAEYLEWLAQRPAIPSQQALARHLGISAMAVNRIIRGHEGYKQAAPRERRAELARRRERLREVD